MNGVFNRGCHNWIKACSKAKSWIYWCRSGKQTTSRNCQICTKTIRHFGQHEFMLLHLQKFPIARVFAVQNKRRRGTNIKLGWKLAMWQKRIYTAWGAWNIEGATDKSSQDLQKKILCIGVPLSKAWSFGLARGCIITHIGPSIPFGASEKQKRHQQKGTMWKESIVQEQEYRNEPRPKFA